MALTLDPRIVDELKVTYKSMEEKGKLLSRDEFQTATPVQIKLGKV